MCMLVSWWSWVLELSVCVGRGELYIGMTVCRMPPPLVSSSVTVSSAHPLGRCVLYADFECDV